MAGTAVTDVDGVEGSYGSIMQFVDYIGMHMSFSYSNKLAVFWKGEDDESDSYQTLFYNVGPSLLTPPASIKDKAKIALQHVDVSLSLSILAQFWVPVMIGGRRFLSTSDQPFGLTCLKKGLCWYRKHCLNHFYLCSNSAADEVIIEVGTRESKVSTGPPSRVFSHGLPEYRPNLEFYSKTEHPMRDEAVERKIKNYMAVPVFGPVSQGCIGVLELISAPGPRGEMDKPAYIFGLITTALQGVGLRTSDLCSHFNLENASAQSSTGLSHALRDIHKALEEACQTHKLPFAQTWTPRSGTNQSYAGDVHVLVTTRDEYYLSHERFSLLRDSCESFQLSRGRGVVWRAFSSGNSCFCKDVAMLSIAEYSFAHVATKVLLDGSFAICLKSDNTAESVYVLELFLPFKTADPRQVLEPVLLTMKKHLNGFRIASGKQLGDEMHVEVLRVSKDDNLDFRLFHTAGNSVGLQDHRNSSMHQQLLSDDGTGWESSMMDIARIPAYGEEELGESSYRNVFPEEDDAFVSKSIVAFNNDAIGRKEESSDSRSGKDDGSYINSSVATSRFLDKEYQLNKISVSDSKVDSYDTKAGRSSASKRINRDIIDKHSHMYLKDAALKLNVSTSTLKRICRECGYPRWPRQKNQTSCSNKGNEKYNPEHGQDGLNSNMSTEQGTTSSKQGSQAATVKSGSLMMTIKATYREIIIKFQLPCYSSRLTDMAMEVASRLKLKLGDFSILYLDEDGDWISLTCDADMRTMESMGKTTIKASIRRTDAPTL